MIRSNRADRRAAVASSRATRNEWHPWESRPWAAEELTRRGQGNCTGAFLNNIYSVQRYARTTDWGTVEQLTIRRHDGKPVRAWGDLQRIKNEIAGEDRIAVEVYPAAGELVDQANMYHLFVLPPGMTLPFGLAEHWS